MSRLSIEEVNRQAANSLAQSQRRRVENRYQRRFNRYFFSTVAAIIVITILYVFFMGVVF